MTFVFEKLAVFSCKVCVVEHKLGGGDYGKQSNKCENYLMKVNEICSDKNTQIRWSQPFTEYDPDNYSIIVMKRRSKQWLSTSIPVSTKWKTTFNTKPVNTEKKKKLTMTYVVGCPDHDLERTQIYVGV